jgi:hypothetical protein
MKYLSSEFLINSDRYAKAKSSCVPAYKFICIYNSEITNQIEKCLK